MRWTLATGRLQSGHALTFRAHTLHMQRWKHGAGACVRSRAMHTQHSECRDALLGATNTLKARRGQGTVRFSRNDACCTSAHTRS